MDEYQEREEMAAKPVKVSVPMRLDKVWIWETLRNKMRNARRRIK